MKNTVGNNFLLLVNGGKIACKGAWKENVVLPVFTLCLSAFA